MNEPTLCHALGLDLLPPTETEQLASIAQAMIETTDELDGLSQRLAILGAGLKGTAAALARHQRQREAELIGQAERDRLSRAGAADAVARGLANSVPTCPSCADHARIEADPDYCILCGGERPACPSCTDQARIEAEQDRGCPPEARGPSVASGAERLPAQEVTP